MSEFSWLNVDQMEFQFKSDLIGCKNFFIDPLGNNSELFFLELNLDFNSKILNNFYFLGKQV
jgi:hypothetical protein